jgi:hypothetical protein
MAILDPINGTNPATATCMTRVSAFKVNKSQLDFRCVLLHTSSLPALVYFFSFCLSLRMSLISGLYCREWDKATVEKVELLSLHIADDNRLIQKIRDKKKFAEQKKKILNDVLSPKTLRKEIQDKKNRSVTCDSRYL